MKEIIIGNHDFYICPYITEDEFAGGKRIIFKPKDSSAEYFFWTHSENNLSLSFALRNILGEDFIVFRCWKSDYKLKKGDLIYFLFDGGDIIEFLLVNKSYSVPHDSSTLENICQITVPELDIFLNKKFLKWKIKSSKDQLEIIGGSYMLVDIWDLQKQIFDYTQAYKNVILNYTKEYKPLYTRTFPSDKYSNRNKDRREKIPQDVMDAVWRRDDGKCVECGSKENLEFDHIIPVSKGGASTYRNIQLLCEECNRRKSNKIG